MAKNFPTAYEGAAPYIFVSYAHNDTERVLPFIACMQSAGFRIWYDGGIQAGNEWPAIIEKHLMRASVLLVFMSNSTVASINCRNEINLALKERKNVKIVYLEETQLREGLALQISSLQSLFAYEPDQIFPVVQKLCAVNDIALCRTEEEYVTPDFVPQERTTPTYAPTHAPNPRPTRHSQATADPAHADEISSIQVLQNMKCYWKEFFTKAPTLKQLALRLLWISLTVFLLAFQRGGVWDTVCKVSGGLALLFGAFSLIQIYQSKTPNSSHNFICNNWFWTYACLTPFALRICLDQFIGGIMQQHTVLLPYLIVWIILGLFLACSSPKAKRIRFSPNRLIAKSFFFLVGSLVTFVTGLIIAL